MQIIIPFVIAILLSITSCNNQPVHDKVEEYEISVSEIVRNDMQSLFDSAHVTGGILIYDKQEKIFYSNNFSRCDEGFLPASTFKIPNSIIALETGVVNDDSTLFKWNGEKRRLSVWEKDLVFRDAFHVSCVPCYQDIARRIGVAQMNKYLQQFQYGDMEVDSSNIDIFWLEGNSKITLRQQVDFLDRFYHSQLGISSRTEKIMKRLMVIENNSQYKLSGKTGWAIRNNNNLGWFVGYIEIKNKIYFFATNMEPGREFNMDLFPKIRNEITMLAFVRLGILNP